jgi:predicted ATPase
VSSVGGILLAAACEIAGQVEEGLTLLDDALRIVERTGERWFAAELNRHKGQLLRHRNQLVHPLAEGCVYVEIRGKNLLTSGGLAQLGSVYLTAAQGMPDVS